MPVRNSIQEPLLVRIVHSPDPDDRFMFWPLRQGWIRDARFRFEFAEADTAALNKIASSDGAPEICAISAVHYGRVAEKYQPLLMGTSLGDGYGPVLVSPEADLRPPELLLTPGLSTTAHAVLSILGKVPGSRVEEVSIVPMERVFTRLSEWHAKGIAVSALLIHEGRLVYERFGCRLLLDLGVAWKERTGGTLPLGINVIGRWLDGEVRQALSALLRDSCRMALARKEEFVATDAAGNLGRKELGEYLSLYANHATVELPEQDRRAFHELIVAAHGRGFFGDVPMPTVDWI